MTTRPNMQLGLTIILNLLSTKFAYSTLVDVSEQKGVLVFLLVSELYMLSKGCPPTKDGLQWVYEDSSNTCYLSKKGLQLVYGAAEIWCRKQGGHLAMPKDEIQNIAKHANSNLYYIGLDDIEGNGKWVWADGTMLRQWQNPWADLSKQKDPNNKYCAQYTKQSKTYHRIDCNMKREFVCEAGDYDYAGQYTRQQSRCPRGSVYFDCGGFCYWYSTTKYNYWEAWGKCKDMGGLPVMPKTRRQWRAVYLITTAASHGNVGDGGWIGVNYIGTEGKGWGWIDHTRAAQKWFQRAQPKRNWIHSCASIHTDPKYIDQALPEICEAKRLLLCQTRQNLPPSQCGEMTRDPFFPRRKKRENRMANTSQLSKSFGASSVGAKPLFSNKIFENHTVNIETVPWLAKLYLIGLMFKCGAVVIGPRWILSAAHCLVNKEDYPRWLFNPHHIYVGYGSEDKYEHEQNKNRIVNFWVPPRYISAKTMTQAFNYDIALLELDWPLPLNCPNVRQICYAPPQKYSYHCFLMGFGEGSGNNLKYCYIKDAWTRDPTKNRTAWLMHDDCWIGKGDSGGPVACLHGAGGPGPYRWDLLGINTQRVPHIPTPNNKYRNYFTLIKPYYNWINRIIGTAKYAVYSRVTDWLTRHDACKQCEERGGILAMPKSWRQLKDMEDVIRKLEARNKDLNQSNIFWIGLMGKYQHRGWRSRDCDKWQFTWSDGTKMDNEDRWTAWQPGEPDDLNNEEGCVAMEFVEAKSDIEMKYKASGWKDLPRWTRLPYICEFSTYKPALEAIPDYEPPDPQQTLYTQRACSDDIVDFSCTYGPGPTWTVIRVHQALYGRWSGMICPSQPQDIGCFTNITIVVARRCNGHNRCRFNVSQLYTLINDKCQGYSSYLEMTYRCEENRLFHQTVCDNGGGERMSVFCAPSHFIHVHYIVWGRYRHNPFVCTTETSVDDCDATYMYIFTQGEICHTRSDYTNCTVIPTHTAWPGADPCPGKSKYYQIFWSCHPGANECYVGKAENYIGTVSKTRGALNNITCQRWDSQHPHAHAGYFNKPEEFIDGVLPENYCRTPLGDHHEPWCYTVQPFKRWDYCGIRECGKNSLASATLNTSGGKVEPLNILIAIALVVYRVALY